MRKIPDSVSVQDTRREQFTTLDTTPSLVIEKDVGVFMYAIGVHDR